MSLLSRLIVTFLAVVSLLLAVGLTSYLIQREIGREVADLRPSRGVDLEGIDLESTHLKIEGLWDGERFVATDVTVGPGHRRPKLRGEIQSLDRERRTLTLYGVPIQIVTDTAFLGEGDPEGERAFAMLSVGQRVEVSAQVLDAGLIARKVRTHGVKSSDQIKGTPTGSVIDSRGPQVVEFDGIRVSVAPVSDLSPNGALRQVELATQMESDLQETRAAAHALVSASPFGSDRPGVAARHQIEQAGEWLEEAVKAFESTIAESAAKGVLRVRSDSKYLDQLEAAIPDYRRNAEELRRRASADAEAARVFLDEVFEPFLQNEMLAVLSAHRGEAEDELGAQVRGISERARTMTGLVLGGSVLSAALAVLLGVLTWRSIRGPLSSLQAAAIQIGQGHLGTRVEIKGPREFEVLAGAFNQMAEDLAASTVSVQNLEDVFDSMAGVLVLLDREGRITRVNQAAEDLLGYRPDELIGKPFALICPASEIRAADGATVVSSEERTFVRADGGEVSVSFSAAELGAGDSILSHDGVGHVCVAQDLSERKLIEERLRAIVGEKELLLREVHHRVKNNMQVVSSLLAMHSGYVDDSEAVQRFHDCQNQIRSMALIHEQLHHASQPSEVDLPGYLQLLASHLLQSFGSESGIHLEVEADDVCMRLDDALTCGLIVNELVTNSLRHGFEPGQGGKIRVVLREQEQGSCLLSVTDNGRGLSSEGWASTSGGLGQTLIETLVKQLHGRLCVGSGDGLEVSVVFKPEVVSL